MKKTSLFILLILLTFSLSQSNFKIHFQSKQAYIGIRETDKIYDYLSNKINLSKEKKEVFKRYLNELEYCDALGGGGGCNIMSIKNKLREAKFFNYLNFYGEHLRINNKYVIYSVYIFEAIVEKPPKYERKCKSGFLGIGKKCKNVEVAQTFSSNENEIIEKEIYNKIIVDAFVDLPKLPKEEYEQYKQMLRFKYPQNKNLK